MVSAAEIPAWVPALVVSAVALSSLALVRIANAEHERKVAGGHPSTDTPEYITAAVPFFFLLMLLEWALIRAIRLKNVAAVYDLGDSLCSVSSGITQQLVTRLGIAAVQPFLLFPYDYIWQRWAWVRPPADSLLLWVGGFLFVDFCYYWLHRLAHQVSVLWAGHSVHHNSDGYRLTTALRQSGWQSFYGWVFYLPLALFMPPPVFYGINQLNTWYQFWVHTCLVRRLGFLEWFLVTPSHHRVHHDRRLHKNFAGSCILWDRLFGTFLDETEMPPAPRGAAGSSEAAAAADKFQEKAQQKTLKAGQNESKKVGTEESDAEEEKHKLRQLELRNRRLGLAADGEELCLFGTYRPPESWTEAVSQAEVWSELFQRRTGGVRRFLVGPGWSTVTARRWLVSPGPGSIRLRLQSRARSRLGTGYVVGHWLLVLALGFSLLLLKQMGLAELGLSCGVCLAGLYCVLGLMDGKPADLRRERIRCALGLGMGVVGSAAAAAETSPFPGSVFLQAPVWLWLGASGVFACSLLLLLVMPEQLRFDTWSYAEQQQKELAAAADSNKGKLE